MMAVGYQSPGRRPHDLRPFNRRRRVTRNQVAFERIISHRNIKYDRRALTRAHTHIRTYTHTPQARTHVRSSAGRGRRRNVRYVSGTTVPVVVAARPARRCWRCCRHCRLVNRPAMVSLFLSQTPASSLPPARYHREAVQYECVKHTHTNIAASACVQVHHQSRSVRACKTKTHTRYEDESALHPAPFQKGVARSSVREHRRRRLALLGHRRGGRSPMITLASGGIAIVLAAAQRRTSSSASERLTLVRIAKKFLRPIYYFDFVGNDSVRPLADCQYYQLDDNRDFG